MPARSLLEQLSILGEMTMAMSRASTAEEVYREALDAIGRVTGSPRASVLLFDPDGVLRFKAWRGLSDAYRAAVEGHTPWVPGQPLPDPILIADATIDPTLAEYRATILAEGIRALSFIPLVTGGGTIGKFMVYYDAPHEFNPEEVQLVRNIAAHTAFAIDRQRAVDLLEAERSLFVGGPTVMFQWRAGPEWTVEYVSPNVQAQWGYHPSELTSDAHSYAALIHPEDRTWVREQEELFVAEGRVSYDQEYRLRHADGTYRWVYDFSIPVRAGSNAPIRYLGYVLDITERKAEAEALLRAEARLRESQRLESLGVLAGGIAHDFNNLLMGMLGNASLALGDVPIGSPVAETVKAIETAARRAADLTRQLLDYSGKGRFVVQRLNLSSLVEESAQLLRTVLARGASIQFQLGADLPAVDGDATQLRQVTMNLLTNASDAIGDRPGVIRIETALVDADRAQLNGMLLGEGLPEGKYVSLEVADTGGGMNPETVARMFDPFFTTKFHGRGLGLAAVLGIVRGHRGAIMVESHQGQGTRFRMLVPAASSETAAPRPRTSGETPVPPLGRERTVLIVDDESMVRDVARRTLLRAGYQVLEAENGRIALQIMAREGGRVNAILLDLTMPELNGAATIGPLKAGWPDVPIILSSGYSAESEPGSAIREGVAAFLQKPYLPADLLRTLRGVVVVEA